MRGEPLTQFEKGKVYVIDFWATWCGGCIASFPHISAVAEKYKDRVRFISVDSYEEAGGNKGKDPVTVVAEFLKTPQGQKLAFDVAVDGPDKTMYNGWINPLRRQGFPTTFVINQEGKIAWIDVNLDHLDWVIGQVLAKTWDIEKAAAVMQKKDAIEDMMFKAFQEQGGMYKEGQDKKIWETILTASEAFENQFPDRKDAVAFFKFMALSVLDNDKIPDLLEEMAANPLCRYLNLGDAAGLTLERSDLSKRDYIAIAKVQERLLLNEFATLPGRGGKSVSAYENLASTYEKAGDLAKAAESIKNAIAMAKDQKAPAEQIEKLQDALNKYEKK
ncbi:MAG: redoxin family protein [Bacteroidales bacterium]|nr:redoxin family protein [Bacteroidales bacterium]